MRKKNKIQSIKKKKVQGVEEVTTRGRRLVDMLLHYIILLLY